MQVRIFNPSKSATQSGRSKMSSWLIEPELTSVRTPEPLMGWTGSKDTLNQIRLKFDTLDEAIEFARKKGWSYSVLPNHTRKLKPRNYADNFKYISPEEVTSKKVP